MFNYIRNSLILLSLMYMFLVFIIHAKVLVLMLCTENSSMQFVRSALPIAVNCYEAGRAAQNFAWPDKLSQLKKDSLEAHLI